MATSSRNIAYRVADSIVFPVDPTVSFNEGDLMYWTGSYAAPISNKSHVATLLGDSKSQNPVAHHGTIKTTAISVGPRRTVKLIAREAGSITTLAAVYFHTDAQSFGTTNNSGDDVLGKIIVDPKEYGSATITLVIGKEYEILLRDSYALA